MVSSPDFQLNFGFDDGTSSGLLKENQVSNCFLPFDEHKIICRKCDRFDKCVVLQHYKEWDLPYDDVNFVNRYGYYRRFPVYSSFMMGDIDIDRVVDLYKKWRDTPEYIGLQGVTEYEQTTFDSEPIIKCDSIYAFVKCCKRGNDVYKYLVYEKFKDLLELKGYSSIIDGRSNLLFVTLTWDTKQDTVDFKRAWEELSEDLNRFRSNVINNFGDVEIFRVYEGTKKGYPHVHMLIWFYSFDFNVISHNDKDGKVSLRIPSKYKDIISSFWHSFVDVQAVDDVSKSVREISKYVTKDLCSKKGDLTNALLWVFGKQSYSISQGFKEQVLKTCKDVDEPSIVEFTREMCNSKPDVLFWRLLGVYGGRELCICGDIWSVSVKEPPPFVLERAKLEGYI